MILLMGIYTFSCFSVFAHNYESEQKWILIRQNVLMFLLQLTAYVVMYLKKDDPKILTLYAASAGFLLAVILLYRILYPKVSKLIVNNMCMLLCIGMIMLTRLEEENAIKAWIYDRRIRNTAVRVCENFICIFCSGKFKPFFGV